MNAERRVAVVTGGGSGVGRAVALALAHAGFAVVVAGRRQEVLDETAASARADDLQVSAIATDVRSEQSVAALFEATVEQFGRVDLLFNNAGLGSGRTSLLDLTYADWQATLETNVTGAFLCSQQAIARMIKQSPRGGRIINNGSISAHTPRPNSTSYTASKHAITGLTKSIALDFRELDIACGQIDIGNADTDLTGTAARPGGALQPDGRLLVEPVIDVAHVVRAVIYMAQLPLDVNVLFMTVMANKMPFVGRG